MIPNDLISSLIIQDQGLGNPLELRGCSKLGTIDAAVEHERGGLAGLANLSPEVGGDTGGTDLTHVVERQFNGYAAEEIVKEHSISDITPGRLEDKMNMLHLSAHRNR
jgi:hypothetical protein